MANNNATSVAMVRCKTAKEVTRAKTIRQLKHDKYIYLMLLPAVLIVLVFNYVPMYGLIMAFQDFDIFDGFLGSKFVGLQNFEKIITQPKFTTAIWNTLITSFFDILINFPAPIILALLLNELRVGIFKKTVQTISYLPHFLSWISVVGIVNLVFGHDGLVNDIRMMLGANERITYLAQQNLFLPFILGSTLWKEVGWGTVIHLANLASINPDLYEAASIDGATKLQKIRYITLPHMLPTVMTLLIFKMGRVFSSNFELVWGLQNPYIDFDVISTIVYETGIQNGNYSMATAMGLLEGLVALALVLITNWISKKVSGSGIL